jgi:hypothetical protein
MAEFFVSYTEVDERWAEWIAYKLEGGGYRCIIQAWDFRPGSNFVLEMHEAARTAERTILVLSPAYLRAVFTAPEWAIAFANDPGGLQRKLVPVRVGACKPEGLLKSIVYIDLVGLDEDVASAALLRGVKRGRAKRRKKPPFPAHASSSPDGKQARGGSMNQKDTFLRGLYAATILEAGRRLTAEQVNGLGETLQIAPTEVLELVERLQGDGLVQLHWGGGLSLTAEGCQRAGLPGAISIGDSFSNLARVLRDSGRANEAAPLFQKAIAIGEMTLGRDHSLTQRYASHYARLLVETGRASEALNIAQSALATHEAASGLNHPWTKDSAGVTADALDALGRTEEAKALRERYGVRVTSSDDSSRS